MGVERWDVDREVKGQLVNYLIIEKCLCCILDISQEIDPFLGKCIWPLLSFSFFLSF